MGCHALHQEIFLTQGLNLGLLYCRQILYCLSHQGNPLCGIKGLNMFHVSLSIRMMLKSLKPGVELNFFTMTFVPQSSMHKQLLLTQQPPAHDGNLKINNIDKGLGLAASLGRQGDPDAA